ncbi:MAG: hypothetical protein CM1200mP4_1640 [Rhodospirillaceae bacterium]|nr:MAG: hypothetical protein CM1200mP4_1640 [Rhodospirillaceae bacterium]
MKSRNLIAIDAMGGDEGPVAAIAGASVAKERFPESKFMVFGDESVCRPWWLNTSSYLVTVILSIPVSK